MTVKKHSVIGGLGSAVAEVLAQSEKSLIPFRILGLPAQFPDSIGQQKYLLEKFNLSSAAVVQALGKLMGEKK